jgi:hypothetical protein
VPSEAVISPIVVTSTHVCEIRLRLMQRFFRLPAFTTLCLQCRVCIPKLLNGYLQLITRTPERFCGAPLRRGQRPD